jgi:hypothetical protein
MKYLLFLAISIRAFIDRHRTMQCRLEFIPSYQPGVRSDVPCFEKLSLVIAEANFGQN